MKNGSASSTKFDWAEAVISDPTEPDEAKVLAAWLMHRVDGQTLDVEMSAATIAEDLGWSIRKVARVIKLLRRKWILVGKGRFANRYKLNLRHVEAAHERLNVLREARREARQAKFAADWDDQKWQGEEDKSVTDAVPEMSSIPLRPPLGHSRLKKLPKKEMECTAEKSGDRLDRPNAVAHAQAAECELVRLLGDGDEERGLCIANFIGPRFDQLRENLQQGSLTFSEIESIAKSASVHVNAANPGEFQKKRSTP